MLDRPPSVLPGNRGDLSSTAAGIGEGVVPTARVLAHEHHHRTVALIIASSLFMQHLDATVLATALPTMARDLRVAPLDMSVALTSYLLALVVFIPASGTIADRYGARAVFRAAVGLFVAGSLACSLAPTLEAIVAARFFQGIGGAMMLPVGRLVLLRSVAKRDMVSAMSWLVMPALIGPIVGPPVGGLIVAYLNWRWIFWINLPVGLMGMLLIGRFVGDVRGGEPRPFDSSGFALTALTFGCLLAAFEAAARTDGLRLAALLLVAGFAAGAAYLRHARRCETPILDVTLMRIPTFRLSLVAGSLARITAGAQPFLLPLVMQIAFGLSPAQSGVVTLATALGSLGMKSVAGHLLRRFGFRSCLLSIGLLGTLANGACGLFRPGWPIGAVFAVLLVSGFLMSFQFTAYNTIAYDEVEPQRMSAATALYSAVQQLMLSLGICTAATALHVSMTLRDRSQPGFADFSGAFWTVTAISLLATLVNLRFDRNAGADLTGRHDAGQQR